MNPYLAELYNTNGYAEKTAAIEEITHAFIKQCSAEGIDLSGASDDQIVDAALDWAEEAGGGYDETEKIAQQFDYFGRVAAHAFNDEVEKIARLGSPSPHESPSIKDRIMSGLSSAKEKAVEFGKKIDDAATRLGAKVVGDDKAIKSRAEKAYFKERDNPKHQGKGLFARINRALGGVDRQAEQAGGAAHAKSLQRSKALRRVVGYGAPVLAAGGLTAGGIAAAKALGGGEKKSHLAFVEEAALARAESLLGMANNGYNVTFDKVANAADDDFDLLVTQRAWEILEENGYA